MAKVRDRRQYYLDNRESYLERDRQRRLTHPDYRRLQAQWERAVKPEHEAHLSREAIT